MLLSFSILSMKPYRQLPAAVCLVVLGGCTLWKTAPPPLPARNSFTRGQLVIHSDFKLPEQNRLLDELVAQRGQLSRKLELPISDDPIQVYLFKSAKQFKRFKMKHFTDFPARRAFFVEKKAQLAVYAHWGDRVAEDLRHEVAHGYLHSIVSHLPLWFDEGLAEYFEVSFSQHGLNRPHVAQLLVQLKEDDSWQPNLERLEQMQPGADMTQLDYAEAWAWVHFLMETNSSRRELFQDYLRALRKDSKAEPLSVQLRKLDEKVEQELVKHIESLKQRS